MADMCVNDAHEHLVMRRGRTDRNEKMLVRLASMLGLEVVPERIEAYDISNLGSEHITAGMICAIHGSLSKKDYRYFRIKGLSAPDDYESMRETLRRRMSHLSDENGSFSEYPDLILLDGGAGHVSVVTEELERLGIDVPVFGMVKDSHHKTRTVVGAGGEVNIARDNEIFTFIYRLQEEVHRFTVSKMTDAKRKTLKRSTLQDIDGIGEKKAKALLAEAGYPDGFAFTLDCPNNRWVNDENVCKALASMWTKAGFKVNVNTMPRAQYFPKVLSFDTSAGMVGWGASTFDALYSLQSLSATFDAKGGNGISNIGRLSNPEMDRLIKAIGAEENAEKRNVLIGEALMVEKKEVLHIPLYEQLIPWAMRDTVEVIHRPDNRLTLEWVTLNHPSLK